MTSTRYAHYHSAQPYFDLIRQALGQRVTGEHFFDCAADSIHYEVRYRLPGWPPVISGKSLLMAAFSAYCQHMLIHRAELLRASVGTTTDIALPVEVVTLEYDVHGVVLPQGTPYHNRFCSVIELAQGKIMVWRDYMDSLAAWQALTAQN